MLLRARSSSSGPDPAERVRSLLARPQGGWLPPPEPGDAVEADAGQADQAERHGGPVDCPLGEASDEQAERSWAPPPAHPPSGRAPLLPISVRAGRFDPGRRGAAALIAIALLAALGAGGVVLRGRPQEVVIPQVVVSEAPLPGSSPVQDAEVVVAVAGKVRTPGLVRLPAGSRVDDAVRAAGGPEPGATTELLNLARKLVDGEQVLVGIDPPPGAPAGPAGPSGSTGLLDLNAASVSDLDALPGIGPVLAQRIVDWRTENERFGSVEQLREVTGIGEAKFADLRAKVSV